GRWAGQKDSKGRLFLDYDPDLFKIIVTHLRLKKLEDPLNPVPLPEVPTAKMTHFCHLLGYFGLETSFYNVSSDLNDDLSSIKVDHLSGEKETFSHKLINDDKELEFLCTGKC
ncbi:MAG: hypothetical protein SGARI_003666, partial [Bacillariaceae sp.]